MLTKERVRELALEAKAKKGLTWEKIGKEIGRNPVGAATIVYGYGASDETEAGKLVNILTSPQKPRKRL